MIGTNLSPLNYYSTNIAFVDAMKSRSSWIAGQKTIWSDHSDLDLDSDGWVRSLQTGQVARCVCMSSMNGHYPAGQYFLRYTGEGTVTVQGGSVVSQNPGEIVLNVVPSNGGLIVIIWATNPANYIRDIKLTMPGFENNPTAFNPQFLDGIKFYSGLRFMNWLNTSNSAVSNWSQRSKTVTVEDMISLCNTVNISPWFTIDHLTDDDYSLQFATLVKDKLDPKLGVKVAHSNEIWNDRFTEYGYCNAQALLMSPPANRFIYHAARTRQIGNIFKSVLGDRVTTVLEGQAGTVWADYYAFPYLASTFPGNMGIDAFAIAPYMGLVPTVADAATFDAMTMDDLFAYVRNTVLPSAQADMTLAANIAKKYGVKLLAYEGGQHLVGTYDTQNYASLMSKFQAFQYDPRIKELYIDYFDSWKKAGGDLFCHFNDTQINSKFGSFGSREWLTQTRADAPKFDAIQTWIEQNPPFVERRIGPKDRRKAIT